MLVRKESVIFVVISFLTVGLILGPSSNILVFAASPRDICEGGLDINCKCVNFPKSLQASCCTYATGTTIQLNCKTCDIDIATGDFVNCRVIPGTEVQPPTPTPSSPAAPQQGSGGVLEQPLSPPLPNLKDNAKKQNDNGVLQPQQPDQGTTQTNDDNKHSKRSDDSGAVSDLPQSGKLTTKKRNSNNDNSPTPPACPDKGPIPPDCTLKPKF
jgi:hypothetical protein